MDGKEGNIPSKVHDIMEFEKLHIMFVYDIQTCKRETN